MQFWCAIRNFYIAIAFAATYVVDFLDSTLVLNLPVLKKEETPATMNSMDARRITGHRARTLLLVAALGLGQACSRSEPISLSDTASSEHPEHLPFHSDVPRPAASNGAGQSADPKSVSSVPFKSRGRPQTLPAGTLLTVQLDRSLSAATAHVGDSFAASVAAPVLIGGNAIVERGAEVDGRVAGALSQHGSGYVELTLSAITVQGVVIPVETSNLFARGSIKKAGVSSNGNAEKWGRGGIKIPKGRRLTFRLTAPITLTESAHQETAGSKLSTE